jgi:uncharacterized protein YkwD
MSHHRSTLSAGLVAAVLAGLLTAAPAEAATPAAEPARTAVATKYARDAFRTTNNQREKHDRSVLRRHDCLQKYARRQARRMANQGRMFHQDLGPIQRDCGMSWVGENVAYGYPTGRSVVREGWMKSPGHRENILRRQFRRMGLAARRGDDGHWYAAQVFGRKA